MNQRKTAPTGLALRKQNDGAETQSGSRFQGKPSRQRREARENKRYQG